MKKIFSTLILLALPLHTSFAAGGFVTCDGPDCNFCNLAQMLHNVINWIFLIIIPIGILLFAFAGLRLVVSRGDPAALTSAKEQLVKIIIGLVIMFASWTIVDTVLKLATGSDLGVWNPVSCGVQNPVGQTKYQNGTGVTVGSTNTGSGATGGATTQSGTGSTNQPSSGTQTSAQSGTGKGGQTSGSGNTNGNSGNSSSVVYDASNNPLGINMSTTYTIQSRPQDSYKYNGDQVQVKKYIYHSGPKDNANSYVFIVYDLTKSTAYSIGCGYFVPQLHSSCPAFSS